MTLLGSNTSVGRKIWDTSVGLLAKLTGIERFAIAQDVNGTGGKEYVTAVELASFINGGGQSFSSLIPVTRTSSETQVYAGTANPTQTSYSTIKLYSFTPDFTNINSSATLNIDGLGAKSIRKIVNGSQANIVAGDQVAGTTYVYYYDGSVLVIFNGKINALYDNLGNLMQVNIDGKYYLAATPTVESVTSDQEFLIRNNITQELMSFPLDQLNTLYVHQSGSSGDGLKRSPIMPYKTITLANNGIVPGEFSLIYVNNGNYNTGESGEIFRDSVNYFLQNGCLVEGAVTAIAETVNIKIMGFGHIRVPLTYEINSIIYCECWALETNGSGSILEMTSCDITIKCYRLGSDATAGKTIILTTCTFNIHTTLLFALGNGMAATQCIILIGGSGFIKSDSVIAYDNDGTTPAIDISGACGDIYLDLGIVGTDNGGLLKSHTNVINISNSSGTVTVDVDTVYGGIVLAPTSTGRVIFKVKGKVVANINGGATVTMGANCLIEGIFKNESTTTSRVVSLTADNATAKDVVLQGGADSVKGAFSLIVVGSLSCEVSVDGGVTLIGNSSGYLQDPSFANI